MILGACPLPNADLMPTQLAYAGFSLRFFNLLQNQGGSLFTLLLILAVGLSLLSGNAQLAAITTFTALLAWLHPVLLVLVAVGCAAFFFTRYLRR
jgi:hypothetical protein